jgi:hypothetical protein
MIGTGTAGVLMTASLTVLIPVVLLGIVGTFCFVGCLLDSGAFPPDPVNNYSDGTVLLTPGVIAYWPLSETKDTDKAAELVSGNVGDYIDPWPAFTIQNPPGPDILSAEAPGTLLPGRPSIVAGDVDKPADDPASPACMVVNGCLVQVPFNTKFVPTASFTVEAWVRPDWSAGDAQAWRFVLDMRDLNPGRGIALFARAEDGQPGVYRWAGMVGNGGTSTAGLTTLASSELQVELGSSESVYLALTFSGGVLSLFVNGDLQNTVSGVSYVPNDAQPLWIGGGAPFVARRPQPADVPSSPLFPFVGAIQDVAIYNAALSAADIVTHYNHGRGHT